MDLFKTLISGKNTNDIKNYPFAMNFYNGKQLSILKNNCDEQNGKDIVCRSKREHESNTWGGKMSSNARKSDANNWDYIELDNQCATDDNGYKNHLNKIVFPKDNDDDRYCVFNSLCKNCPKRAEICNNYKRCLINNGAFVFDQGSGTSGVIFSRKGGITKYYFKDLSSRDSAIVKCDDIFRSYKTRNEIWSAQNTDIKSCKCVEKTCKSY